MARPTTKEDLINTSKKNYTKLINLINSIPEENRKENFNIDITGKKELHWQRDKNIRDVLVHLYEWHELMLKWVSSNKIGANKNFLPDKYNWRSYGEMNQEFWENNQDISYDDIFEKFKESHKKIDSLIETFTNEELFSKGVFDWVGGTTLGSYFVSVTSSHYNWAMKKIRLFKKTL